MTELSNEQDRLDFCFQKWLNPVGRNRKWQLWILSVIIIFRDKNEGIRCGKILERVTGMLESHLKLDVQEQPSIRQRCVGTRELGVRCSQKVFEWRKSSVWDTLRAVPRPLSV